MRVIWNDVQTKVFHWHGALQSKENISAHHVLYEFGTWNLFHSKNYVLVIWTAWIGNMKLNGSYYQHMNICYDTDFKSRIHKKRDEQKYFLYSKGLQVNEKP